MLNFAKKTAALSNHLVLFSITSLLFIPALTLATVDSSDDSNQMTSFCNCGGKKKQRH